VRSALCLADDLLNCSFKKRPQLEWTLRKNHPNTLGLLKKIVDITSDHNLSDPEQNIAFRRRLIKEMNWGGVWSESDNVKSIKGLILKVGGVT
jgi:hypothetical protein